MGKDLVHAVLHAQGNPQGEYFQYCTHHNTPRVKIHRELLHTNTRLPSFLPSVKPPLRSRDPTIGK